MVAMLYRRMTPRAFAIAAILLTVILCLYYASLTSDVSTNQSQTQTREIIAPEPLVTVKKVKKHGGGVCPKLQQSTADIDTVQIYKDFDFQPAWMKSKEYWDDWFEQRYENQRRDPNRPPLKVILIPHSHNDPGWLKTFEHYFHYESKQILNNMVAKLQQHPNLTFIWSEVSFLSAWWDSAHPSKQRALRKLVKEGRVEITTGGWVMTDEANSHVYAMVDQLIEGHQWLRSNLGITPRSGWSIDPFGHGSTVPYLLSTSGVTGTIIQRIHYAWKQWLAQKQYGDFHWIPNWNPHQNQNQNSKTRISERSQILTHNQPFDIYSIKHSCGPHPYICLNFDFRKIPGEYTEYSIKAQNINDKNVKQKAELLLAQYARTGSLFPHNVVLMPIGDDFRYNHEIEWDQQYNNYAKLIDYINGNKDIYKTEIQFGTPKDYFDEILKRYDQYPTLRGDFFVYSDIFSEGRPAYWSGYFTTRPFMKLLDRELENSLRAAEILYTVALNKARQNNFGPHVKVLERSFEKLVRARRNLGLFQHHDAITGTSKAFVMRDYGLKLFESLRDTESIQQDAIQSLLLNDSLNSEQMRNIIMRDLERESYEKLPKKLPVVVETNQRKIVLFNSLTREQEHFVNLRISSYNIKLLDYDQKEVNFQINPIWNNSNPASPLQMSKTEFELLFIAKIPALSIATYTIVPNLDKNDNKSNNLATIYCNNCHRKISKTNNQQTNEFEFEFNPSKFKVRNTQPGDIQLENHKMKLLFDGTSGFMKSVTRKHKQKVTQCAISFAAYHSAQFHSGAYLFMPDPNSRDSDTDVLEHYNQQISIIISTGPILSELTVIYGAFLIHSVTIFHIEGSPLSDAIHIKNVVDFENPPKNRETELFMRFSTDIQNGDTQTPEFYSDLNGFSMQKRIKVDRIGIEGNYFPITQMAYIQDDDIRLSLLTNHAQGAASWQPGYLEVMLDRRTLYDDSRGMGEGLVDNRQTPMKFWLLIEDVTHKKVKRDETGGETRFKRDVHDAQGFENGKLSEIRDFDKVKWVDGGESQKRFKRNVAQNEQKFENGEFELERDFNERVKRLEDLEIFKRSARDVAQDFDDTRNVPNYNKNAVKSSDDSEIPKRFARNIAQPVENSENVQNLDENVSKNLKRFTRNADYDNTFDDGEIVRHFNVQVVSTKSENFSRPSLFANHFSNMLNYPVGIFVIEDIQLDATPKSLLRLLTSNFPCDLHLMTLRTQSDPLYPQFPSTSALMVFHRQGFDCSISENYKCDHTSFSDNTKFVDLKIENLEVMSLTALHREETLNSIDEIEIQPMALKTLNVTFVK